MTTQERPSFAERLRTQAAELGRLARDTPKNAIAALRKNPTLAVWALVLAVGVLWLWGWSAIARLRRTSSFTAGALVLAIGAAWYWDLPAAISSWSKDQSFLFDPAAEGVIIVDTPQLFTRERLVNERLLESGWIDEQIEKVSKKLDAGEFGRVRGLELTKLLLDIKNRGADTNGNSAGESGLAGPPVNKALGLLKDLGGLDPSPRAAFDEAHNYREHLAFRRYEAILDDARPR